MNKLNKKLNSLSEITKSQLSKILNAISGTKDLILEPQIIKPLERICGVSWLKSHGIEKIYKLDTNFKIALNINVFIIYTIHTTFKALVDIIKSQVDIDNPVRNKFHIICVPKHLYVFEDLLEKNGLLNDLVKLYSLQWQPICIDTGQLSLEIPYMYKYLYIKQDLSLLPIYTRALWNLFLVFGQPKFYLAIGQYSCAIMSQYSEFYSNLKNEKYDSDFGSLIIMDRNIDYSSALLTPHTYAALLNEIYNVNCGVCEWKIEENSEKYDDKMIPIIPKNNIQFSMDSQRDTIYRKLKSCVFTEVTNILSALTKQLKTEGEQSKSLNLDDMKEYVKIKLPAVTAKKKSISNHVAASEDIVNHLSYKFEKQINIERDIIRCTNKNENFNYLEEILQTLNDKYESLTLFCLMVVTQKLSDSEVKRFLHKYFLEFGYDLGFLYRNLIEANFIQEISSNKFKIPTLAANPFLTMANKLKLIPPEPEKIDLRGPTCCSYVFGGCYVPLISQLCALILSGTPLKDIELKLNQFSNVEIRNGGGYPLTERTLLVVIVGGMTYAEVAACGLLEALTGGRIIVLSDKFISGKDISQALTDLK